MHNHLVPHTPEASLVESHGTPPSAHRLEAQPALHGSSTPFVVSEADTLLRPEAWRNRPLRLLFTVAASLACVVIVTGMSLVYVTDVESLTFFAVTSELWVEGLAMAAVCAAAIAIVAAIYRPSGYVERNAATAVMTAGAIIASGRIIDLGGFAVASGFGQTTQVGSGLWTMLSGGLALLAFGAITRSNATYGWADKSARLKAFERMTGR
jgi:hypothetical protein